MKRPSSQVTAETDFVFESVGQDRQVTQMGPMLFWPLTLVKRKHQDWMGILSCNIQLRHQRSRIVSFQGRKAQLYKSCILSPDMSLVAMGRENYVFLLWRLWGTDCYGIMEHLFGYHVSDTYQSTISHKFQASTPNNIPFMSLTRNSAQSWTPDVSIFWNFMLNNYCQLSELWPAAGLALQLAWLFWNSSNCADICQMHANHLKI